MENYSLRDSFGEARKRSGSPQIERILLQHSFFTARHRLRTLCRALRRPSTDSTPGTTHESGQRFRAKSPPTKKREKIHGNAGRACSRSDFRQLALHVAGCGAEKSKDSAAIYDFAGHDRGHWRSTEGTAVERRVARTAGGLG